MPERREPGVRPRLATPPVGSPAAERAVRIPFEGRFLDADLTPARERNGLVIFAHGSGSGRRSPRNREVAHGLQARGIGTLLLDLLDADEARVDERTAQYRFDIPRLTGRLVRATDWLLAEPDGRGRSVGYYGASTGGAVALRAAVERPAAAAAAVLRGARSDLADEVADRVACPTLLLVGSEDPEIRELNAGTLRRLTCPKRLVVVRGASHLFEEPGTLEEVTRETVAWFLRHLAPAAE